MATVTRERVMELLNYDPETGVFTWRIDLGRRYLRGHIAGHINGDGYRCITIDGREYKASRLAWLIVKGEWPPHMIDHRDLDRANNRFDNLREATRSQNMVNTKVGGNNTTGFKGVSRHGSGYRADIHVSRRHRYLGTFPTAEAAHARYCQEAKRLHGEFARCA